MDDYSAGHITTEEGHQLIASVEKALGRDGLRFHGGVSYRHLLVWRGAPADIQTQPPHDISGKPVADHLPSGERQEEVRALMDQSIELFRDHPVNRARIAAGKKPGHPDLAVGPGPFAQAAHLRRTVRAERRRHHRRGSDPGPGPADRPGGHPCPWRDGFPRHQLRRARSRPRWTCLKITRLSLFTSRRRTSAGTWARPR